MAQYKLFAIADDNSDVHGIWITRDGDIVEFARDETPITDWQSHWVITPYSTKDDDSEPVYGVFWQICAEFEFVIDSSAKLSRHIKLIERRDS